MCKKTLEHLTIRQQLIVRGVEEEMAQEAQRIACVLFNIKRGVGSYDILETTELTKDKYSNHLRAYAHMQDTLRLLEEHGFVEFDRKTGKYRLTKRGMKSYETDK